MMVDTFLVVTLSLPTFCHKVKLNKASKRTFSVDFAGKIGYDEGKL
jgi:hypothetical protein